MKTVIEMAREAEFPAANYPALVADGEWEALARFAALVRADERNSWPAEMEAMERQVNILTDALAQAKAEEREACAKVLDEMAEDMEREMEPSTAIAYVRSKAATIRARGETK